MIESGLVREGSINGVLSGKYYNRSVLSHKILYEAIERLRFEAFIDQLEGEEKECLPSFLNDMVDVFPKEEFREYVTSTHFQEVFEEYERFVLESYSRSRTFAFWTMYIRMTGTVLYIKYSPQSNVNKSFDSLSL